MRDQQEGSPTRPIDPQLMKDSLANLPTGLVALTGTAEGRDTVMVASTFLGISLEPAIVGVSIQRSSETWQLMRDSPSIVVSVLSASHSDIIRTLSSKTGNRLRGVATERDDDGILRVAGSVLWMQTYVLDEIMIGDHTLVTLAVQRVISGDDAAKPIVFHGRQFGLAIPIASHVR